MLTIYGIKNCDTVKKCLKHCNELDLKYDFYDYKKTPPTKELLLKWHESLGEFPINPKGRTFKQYKDQYESATKLAKIKLLMENTSMLKRPIIESKKSLIIGFNKEEIEKL
ncbi:MAG: arsenate reductase [Thermoproteota archaeon]|jgi:arsenate reductase